MSLLTRGQQIDKYMVQSLIKENLYTETYRVENEDWNSFFMKVFVTKGMPAIFDVTEDNQELVLDAANKANSSIKVIKCCFIQDNVWVFFENSLDSTPEVSVIIPCLAILQGAQQQFRT